MILIIDNYDSFTYNLYQSLAGQGAQVEVFRNDAIGVDEVVARAPAGVVLSPGPGRPHSAGICLGLLEKLPADIPLLGVCLGHQSLVERFGGELGLDPVPVHGKASLVHHGGGCELLADLPDPFPAGRYHSLRAAFDRNMPIDQFTRFQLASEPFSVQDINPDGLDHP